MELHILPFGRAAWDKRKSIVREIIGARPGPPYDYRDVVWIVPNERSVLSLRALFLDTLRETTGAGGCLPPRISAMNRLVESLAARHSARPVVDSTTRSLVIEELTRAAASGRKDIELPPDTLAPSTAPLIASALDRIYTYGVTDAALNEVAAYSLPASLLSGVKRSYERWLREHGLSDPAASAASLEPGPEDFAGYRTAVLDGFYDADPVELRVMKALSGLPESRFVLEAPGLGIDGMTGESMPYSGTDTLIAALGLSMPDEDRSRSGREAEAVSAALFGGRPITASLSDAASLKPLSGDITVVGATNRTEEAHYAAYAIKRGARSGEIPDLDRVLVYLPDPDAYLPDVERAMTEAGIPFHTGPGRRLVQSPACAALLRLLSVPAGGYTFAAIRAALSSPLLSLGPDGNHAEAFARFGRLERITRGRRAWLERLESPKDPDSANWAELARSPLTRLIELAGMLPEGRAALSTWCAATREIIAGSGMEGMAGELSTEEPGLVPAVAGLIATVDNLAESAARLTSRMSLSGFTYLLRKALSEKRYAAGEREFTGVRVLTGLEILSEPFDTVFALGLSEGASPVPYTPDIFFGGPQASELGLPGRPQHDTREARRFLSLVLCAGKVHLVYPRSGRRGPAPAGPYIRSLRPFIDTGAVNNMPGWARPSDPAGAESPAGFMRALALRASVPGGPAPATDEILAVLDELPETTPGIHSARAAIAPAKKPGTPSPPAKREFSVTELELYRLCHYRYYHDKVLGSAPVEDPEDDIAPHRAGSIIHEILGRFYREAKGPVTGANMHAELSRLRGIASELLGRLPDTVDNLHLKKRFDEFLAPRFIETESRLSASGYGPCGFEESVRVSVRDDVYGEFVITGKVDRVELDADGRFVVVDYKTGLYPGSGRRLSELFQLPLYAHMLREKGLEGLRGAKPKRPVGFVYYNLKDGSMRDVVLYEAGSGFAGSGANKKRSVTPEVMDERVKEAFDEAVKAVRGILSSEFGPSCRDGRVCERCAYVEVCERGARLDEQEEAEAVAKGDTDED